MELRMSNSLKVKNCFALVLMLRILNLNSEDWTVKLDEPLGTFMVNQHGFNGQSIIKPNFAPCDESEQISLSVATENIKIDGDLSEVWANAESLHEFIAKNTGNLAQDQTEIKIIFDEKHIFIGAVCNESQMENIVSNCQVHDSPVMLNDYIGIYLTPLKRPNEKHFYEGYYYFIAINPSGTVFDAFYNPWHGGIFYPNWNPQLTVVTRHQSDQWIIEAELAFDGLEFYLPILPDGSML